MKRVFGNVAAILIAGLVLVASCSTATEPEVKPSSLLWEISSGDNTVYILGSVHVAGEDIYPLNEVIEDAYSRSEVLVLEVDDSEIDDLWGMMSILRAKSMYGSGDSLEQHIPADLYSRLSDRLAERDKTGLIIRTLSLFEPWVAAMMLVDLDYQALGYESDYGIDRYFLDKARDDGKDIIGLETAEFQLDILDGMTEELQIYMLEAAIDSPVTEAAAEMLFNAWSTGDVAMMEMIVFAGTDNDPMARMINEKVLDERNLLMADKIGGFLENDTVYFVVVGAGHLVGENGIINLLDEKGYEVSRP